MASDHNHFANLIWQIADLLRGPYRPPQYERVMLPMTVLRRFDCVLAGTKAKVLAAHGKHKRFETWRKAHDALRRLSQNDTVELREQIVDTALATGLFSIWWTVFAADGNMRSRLRAAFVGTCSNSFDANGNLQARPGGQL
jgi:hypothetical protein